MYLGHQSQRDALVKGLHVNNVPWQPSQLLTGAIQRVGACALQAEVYRLHNSQTLPRIRQHETAEHVEHFQIRGESSGCHYPVTHTE